MQEDHPETNLEAAASVDKSDSAQEQVTLDWSDLDDLMARFKGTIDGAVQENMPIQEKAGKAVSAAAQLLAARMSDSRVQLMFPYLVMLAYAQGVGLLGPGQATSARIIVKTLIIPGDKTKEGLLVRGVSKLWFQILRMIQSDPDSIHQIDCWKWEEILAGAYKQDGWETVVLTPKRGDHGIDVIAERKGWGQLRFLLLDQMKAYKPGHLIGPDEIREMKGVLLDHPEASKGLITTTADFTPGAMAAAANLAPRLELRSREKLVEWLLSAAGEELRTSGTVETRIQLETADVQVDTPEKQAALRNLCAAINEAIDFGPADAPGFCEQAHSYRLTGDFEKAIADFTEAIRLQPDYAGAYFGRALTYWTNGSNEKAIADFAEAIRLQPDYAEGVAYEEIEPLLGQVMEILRQSLDDLDYTKGLIDRAALYESIGRNDKSIELYTQAIATRERLPNANTDVQLAIDLNNLALRLRKLSRLEEAEPRLRRALEIDEKARGELHPKIPHRLNNLCTVLVMQDKLNEAKELLARAWRLKTGQHDLTSARLLFVRLAIAMLEAQPSGPFLGQLRTFLELESLADHADVAKIWDISDFIEHLGRRLSPESSDLLTALAAALNDRGTLSDLGRVTEWSSQPPLQLETPWPHYEMP